MFSSNVRDKGNQPRLEGSEDDVKKTWRTWMYNNILIRRKCVKIQQMKK